MADMPHRVAVVVFDDVQALDVMGPTEVLTVAGQVGAALGRQAGYELVLLSPDGRPVRASSGITLGVDAGLAAFGGPVGTLLIAGGTGVDAVVDEPAAVAAVARIARGAERVASVCTGAFVLGAAGLLDGRRATTHWAWCDELADRHPDVRVDATPIFVRDDAPDGRQVWTSAGVTAGMDLALALVAEDHGEVLAHEVARWLVLYTRRPGGQAQFSTHLRARPPESPSLRDLLTWIPEHLDEDLSVASMASRVAMAPRTFARAFAREVGMTPAAYVEAIRVETATGLLAQGDDKVAAIARHCGFGTAETLHRAFRRRTGTTPGSYRDHFRHDAAHHQTRSA